MYTVIGIENVDYTNKMGKRIQGTKYHCHYENSNRIVGFGTDSFYVPLSAHNDAIILGTMVEPLYNRYGNVSELRIVG